jgi:HSP20 family protein
MLDRMMNESFGRFDWEWPELSPHAMRVDVQNQDDRYLLEAEIPGVSENDVDINVEDNMLTISVEQKKEDQDEKTKYMVRERLHRSLKRSFTLPKDADREAISASFDRGILTLDIPKSEDAKPRKIKISSSNSGS